MNVNSLLNLLPKLLLSINFLIFFLVKSIILNLLELSNQITQLKLGFSHFLTWTCTGYPVRIALSSHSVPRVFRVIQSLPFINKRVRQSLKYIYYIHFSYLLDIWYNTIHTCVTLDFCTKYTQLIIPKEDVELFLVIFITAEVSTGRMYSCNQAATHGHSFNHFWYYKKCCSKQLYVYIFNFLLVYLWDRF